MHPFIIDVILSFMAFLVCAVMPGFLVALMLGIRSLMEAILYGVLLSFGVVIIWGILLSFVDLPFTLLSFGVLLIILLIPFIYLWTRNRIHLDKPALRDFYLLIPSLIIVFTLEVVAAGQIVPPHVDDAYNHSEYTYYIWENRTVHLARPYPNAFHCVNALAYSLVPVPLPRLILQLSIFHAALFPIAAFLLTSVIVQNRRIAFLTALFSTTFVFPMIVYWGGGWTVTLGVLYVGASIYALLSALKKQCLSNWFIFVLLSVALIYSHPVDILSVFLIGMVILPFHFRYLSRKFGHIIKLLFISSLLFFILVLPAIPDLLSISEGGVFMPRSQKIWELNQESPGNIQQFILFFWYHPFSENNNYVMPFLALFGILYLLFKRRHLFWLTAFAAVVISMFLWLVPWLKPFLVRIHPWPMAGRLLYLWVFFLPLFSIAGLYYILSKRAQSLAMILLLIICIVTLCITTPTMIQFLVGARDKYAPQTESDFECFEWIKNNTPPNTIVLTNLREDIGEWITFLTHRKATTYLWGTAPSDKRDEVLKDIFIVQRYAALLAQNPEARQAAKRLGISYAFCASKNVVGRVPQLNADDLFFSPGFKLAFKSGNSYVFEYLPDIVLPDKTPHLLDVGVPGDSVFLCLDDFRGRSVWGGLEFTYRWTSQYFRIILPSVEGIKGLRLIYICEDGQSILLLFNERAHHRTIPPSEGGGLSSSVVVFDDFSLNNQLIEFWVDPPIITPADKLGIALGEIEILSEEDIKEYQQKVTRRGADSVRRSPIQGSMDLRGTQNIEDSEQ